MEAKRKEKLSIEDKRDFQVTAVISWSGKRCRTINKASRLTYAFIDSAPPKAEQAIEDCQWGADDAANDAANDAAADATKNVNDDTSPDANESNAPAEGGPGGRDNGTAGAEPGTWYAAIKAVKGLKSPVNDIEGEDREAATGKVDNTDDGTGDKDDGATDDNGLGESRGGAGISANNRGW